MKQVKRYLVYVVALLLLFSPFNGLNNVKADTSNEPALTGTVSPAGASEDDPLQAVLSKPANGPALGSININVTPQGMLDESIGERAPVDVVFVMDTSGSMAEKVPGKFKVEKRECKDRFLFFCTRYEKRIVEVNEATKLFAAKTALNNAIDEVFSQNVVEGDKYALVSFADDAIISSNLTTNTDFIKTKVENLNANGGTNYTQALSKANEILANSNSEGKKYIIFLTDGEPTVAIVTENNKNYKYTIFTNGAAAKYKEGKILEWVWIDSLRKSAAETVIKNSISSVVSNIKTNNISLYSIGFVTSDVEFNYLKSISDKAERGNSENLSSIYNEFANEITEYGIKDVVAKVKLPKAPTAPRNVGIQEGVDVKTEGGYAIVNIAGSVPYIPGGNTPVLEKAVYSLPLQFTQEGEYIFDDIQLVYNDISGNQKAVNLATAANPIKFIVSENRIAPQLTGTVSFNKDVSKLEKEGTVNSESNQFNVNYKINPTGGTGSGTINGITIKQPLPDGISAISSGSSNFVLEHDIYGNKYALITLNNIAYQEGAIIDTESKDFPSIGTSNTNFSFTFKNQDISGTVVVPGNERKWHVHFDQKITAEDGFYIILENNLDGVLVTDKTMNNLTGKPIKLVKKSRGQVEFNPGELAATLKLQADYALLTELPDTIVQYRVNGKDNISKITESLPKSKIKNVITLKSGTKHSPIIGDHTGQIVVTTKDTNNSFEKYGVKANEELHKAVKTMEFASDIQRYVKVKYSDDSYGLVNLYDVGISFNKASYNAKIGETQQNAVTVATYPSGFQPTDIVIEASDPSIVEISPKSGQTLQRNINGLKQGMTKITARISYNDFDIDNDGNLLEQLKSKSATALVKVSGEVTKPGGTDKDW